MRVLVTGGTGFVGSHAVAALLQAGHDVRLLVRSAERIASALAPLGVGDVEHVVGDVTDRASVGRAVEGCDAVVHAASVYSLSARAAGLMEQVNVASTVNVLDEAARAGLDPIVYVSSTVAFMPGDASPAGPDSPVGEPAFTYARTKADAEREARRRQARGDPVAIVYPGAVYGADDPYLGEQAALVRNLLKRRLPVLPREGFHAVDIADVAATIVALLEPGRGARRFVVPGHHATTPEIAAELTALTGRRLPHLTLPARALMPAARAADVVQRLIPARLPISAEAIYVLVCDLRFDASRTRRELGISPRPLAQTLAEMVPWLVDRGLIRGSVAGRVLSAAGSG